LSEFDLNISNLVAYSADDAYDNYSINNSVYVYLKNDNSFIEKANCNCHVVDNSAQKALRLFTIDISNLVLKLYAEFSTSVKKVVSRSY